MRQDDMRKRLKQLSITIIIVFLLNILFLPIAKAQEGMKTIFMDTFYGMAAGALIGSALALTQDHPDWGEKVGTGAAVGGIAGALFGIVTEMRYMATIGNEGVQFAIPSIGVELPENKRDTATYMVGLMQYRF